MSNREQQPSDGGEFERVLEKYPIADGSRTQMIIAFLTEAHNADMAALRVELTPKTSDGGEFELALSDHLDETSGAYSEILAAHVISRAADKARITELEEQLEAESELVLETLESNRRMRDEGKYMAPFHHENPKMLADALVTKEILSGKQHVKIKVLEQRVAELVTALEMMCDIVDGNYKEAVEIALVAIKKARGEA